MGTVTVRGERVAAGTRAVVRLPVTVDLDGGSIDVYVHVLAGAGEGPTLTAVATQHGDEWICIPMMKRLADSLDPTRINGAVVLIPAINPTALGMVGRNTQMASDNPDLNRIWPGGIGHGWIAEQLAKAVDDHVLAITDYLVDFHLGPWGCAFNEVFYGHDFPDTTMVERCRQLALAFGCTSVGRGNVAGFFPGPGSMMGYCPMVRGIPTIGVEIGGGGWDQALEDEWHAANVRGVHNVMRHLNMTSGALELPDRVLLNTKKLRVNPSFGGFLIPTREPDELLREVKANEALGQVVSPYTFETLEELRSPIDGYLFYMARTTPIHPGGWGFGVIEKASAEWVNPAAALAGASE